MNVRILTGGTLFSGVGAPEFAMPSVDWRWSAEIDPFARAVHAARFPDVPNLGDVTRIDPDAVEPVDLIVFGSPCQSFSVAGKRLGLDDARGNLALIALRLIGRIRPRWVVFENVPGLLSSDGGRDFGAFLGLLGECGYGFAYRILDAQYAGVPQRCRRVFVVGYLGDWRPPAAVLFESESLRGDTAPRREAWEGIAPTIEAGANRTGGTRPLGTTVDTADSLIATAVNAHGGPHGRLDFESETFVTQAYRVHGEHSCAMQGNGIARVADPVEVARSLDTTGGYTAGQGGNLVTHTLRADGFDASEDKTGRGTPLVAAFHYKMGAKAAGIGYAEEQAPVLDTYAEIGVLTLAARGRGDSHDLEYRDDGIANAILTPGGGRSGTGVGAVAIPQTLELQAGEAGATAPLDRRSGVMSVRRLTPRQRECARLQGFPDDWLDILYRGKPAADGPKYKALGNAMCVPVIRWIGERIRQFESIHVKRNARLFAEIAPE